MIQQSDLLFVWLLTTLYLLGSASYWPSGWALLAGPWTDQCEDHLGNKNTKITYSHSWNQFLRFICVILDSSKKHHVCFITKKSVSGVFVSNWTGYMIYLQKLKRTANPTQFNRCVSEVRTACLLGGWPGPMGGWPMLGGPCGWPGEGMPGWPGIRLCFWSRVLLFSSSSFWIL